MSLIYKGQNLYVDNTPIRSIAKKNITPFYVYSYEKMRTNYQTFYNYFKKVNPIICFSVKSNSNVSLISELGKLGSGADVVSEGELMKALKAKIKPSKMKDFYKDSKRVNNKKVKKLLKIKLKFPTFKDGLRNLKNQSI